VWLVVHLIYLGGFKNRFTTLIDGAVAFIGRGTPSERRSPSRPSSERPDPTRTTTHGPMKDPTLCLIAPRRT